MAYADCASAKVEAKLGIQACRKARHERFSARRAEGRKTSGSSKIAQIASKGKVRLKPGESAVWGIGRSRRSSSAMQEQGFIHEYAKASIEEDFNAHAAALFMGQAQHWESLEQYPKLKAKSGLVMAFYAKLHPSLTRAHFQALRRKEPQ